MVTAGSVTGPRRGFAIPIKQALQLARRIESGRASATVHVGPTAFLGVVLVDAQGGAEVNGVVSGKPAADAGLVVGDVITSLAGKTISSKLDVRRTVLGLVPGRAVSIGWTDTSGMAHSGTITPTRGPPQ
jgi:S1-C subfamily serine protease